MIKVILRENVENLGKIGDVVRVSDGYARNFLLPRNLCTLADDKNMAMMEHHTRELERKKKKSVKTAQELAAKIEGYSCTIARKVGEQEKLFGSVTAADIAASLQKEGYAVERRQVSLSEPIKQLGVFTVPVKLNPEVTANLKVWVVEQK